MLVWASFATAGLGQSITGEDGKLSLSNLAPVLFAAVAGPAFLAEAKSVNKNIVGLFLLFNVCAMASFALFMFRYGWEPNFPVLLFQDVELAFVLLLAWYARRRHEEFFSVAKAGILCSTLIAAAYGIVQFRKPDVKGIVNIVTFSMDDKSQAAVLFCCWAYILLRYFDGWLTRIFAYGLLAMSLMTLSRLPAVFLPVMLVTLCVRTRYGFVIAAATVCGVVGAFVAYGDELLLVFKALDRLSSPEAGDATSAHLLLIESALEMKFTDFTAFFFGTGPGNFSKALTSFPIDIHQLESLDPALVGDARLGRAPMHSTPISMLLDYNIVIFSLLAFLALRAVRHLLEIRHYLDLMFLGTLCAASLFYSLHNKPYFYLAIATIAIGTLEPCRLAFVPRNAAEREEYRQYQAAEEGHQGPDDL